MSLRSLAALWLLVLLCGCSALGKPQDASIDEIERRHEEMMMRGLGTGTGM